MIPLILILLSLALFIGFLTLTWYEERQGSRLVGSQVREQLDARVTRISYVLAHVDIPAFIREEVRRAVRALGQALATLSLSLVRAIERLLTRLVRYMRMRQSVDGGGSEGETRPFVKSLSAFKDRLKKTKKSDVPPVE